VAFCLLGSQLTRSVQQPPQEAGGRLAASASSSLKENIKDVLKSSGVFALPQVCVFSINTGIVNKNKLL
jgi:hypothetical protein